MANILDKIIEVFNPILAIKREAARTGLTALKKQRGYEAAQNSRRNPTGANNTSAAREVSRASVKLASEAQEACRNNPLAQRIKMAWANSIVGKGIIPELMIDNKARAKKCKKIITKWAKSTDCDFDGVMNLSGLQWLWAAAAVETGGCFVRIHIDKALVKEGKFPLQFQTIEQTYLDRSKNDGDRIVDGIQYSENGKIEGYWIRSDKSGLNLSGRYESIYYEKDIEMIHMYRKERPSQHLGVTWFAQVLTLLDKYNTLQDAVLMQQQVAACLGVIVQEAETPLGTEGDGSEDKPDEIYPGSINYLKSNATVSVVNPPKASDTGQFTTGIKNDIAAGVNLTYPQLTGDYSKFNFASGRMGKNDFFETLDHAQFIMMLPVLTKIGDAIIDLLYVKEGAQCELSWSFPPRTMVNPKEDFELITDQVRSGMLSPSAACKMLGRTLEDVIAQWKLDKVVFGDLPFDLDPSKFSAAGNQIIAPDNGSDNKDNTDNE